MSNGRIVDCRSCGAKVVFMRTSRGARIPVEADTATDGSYDFDPKKGHVSHFARCPQANAWRRPTGRSRK